MNGTSRSGDAALQFELSNGRWMRIYPVAPHTFRIRMNSSGQFTEPALIRSGIVCHPDALCEFAADRSAHMVYIQAGQAGLAIDTRDGQFRFIKPGGQELLGTLAAPKCDVPAGFSITFMLHDEEVLYGIGDSMEGRLQKRGQKADMWCNRTYPYIPVPFVMSSRNWGLMLVTTHRHEFDLGCTDKDVFSLTSPEGELDLYLFAGSSFSELLDRYTNISGKPKLLPIWAYGLSFIGNENTNARDIIHDALKFREADIPCDLMVLNNGWSQTGDDGSANHKWHPDRFPMPARSSYRPMSFIDTLTIHGFKLSLRSFYDYDFASSEERPQALIADGANSFQILESDDWEAHQQPPLILGVEEQEQHNLYPVLLVKKIHDVFLHQTGLRPFIVHTKVGYTGIQQFAATPSGQYGRIDEALVAVLGYGLIGHSHTTINMDLSTREGIHIGFLQTWAQVNNWSDLWHPYLLEDSMRKLFQKYAKLRYRLMPYLYAAAHAAARTGLPVVRAMLLMYPNDPNCRELQHQYMLGEFLLVAAFSKPVYLPAGIWIDYWTGERYNGLQTLNYTIPDGTGGPLFIRAGAIIPYWPDMDYIGHKKVECLTLHVYPHQYSEFVLYEDDGETLQYTEEQIAVTHIRCEADGERTRVDIARRIGTYNGMPAHRSYDLVIHTESKPLSISINGKPLLEQKHPSRTNSASSGWRYTRRAGTIQLHAEETTRKDSLQIEIVYPASASRKTKNRTEMLESFHAADQEAVNSTLHPLTVLHTALNNGDPEVMKAALDDWWTRLLIKAAVPRKWRLHLLNAALLAIRHAERHGGIAEDVFGQDLDTLFMLQNVTTPNQGLDLLQRLFVQSIQQACEPVMPSLHPAVRETIAIVKRDIAKKLSLYEIAAQIGSHPSHLSRLFLKEAGLSFTDFTLKERMERAKEMLEAGLKVHEAAAATGFTDVPYFSRTFSKYWGVPPVTFKGSS
ncbi:DUF5110 domain-containing protein [Paenibacillus eucommiae]|uniref:Alpha-glucosidase (Family GH31 glycosyl hydrolase)/AraC-like DNA-binding protein n=1 Tax=Paenibacillus eucommiae TaxID=1355755 RepID=A0ABS4IWT6_9BACL|nr:DUF5110 domain-containing protein [Paenibacillus eucommiae]MBP1992061.1 alpha-glucosidase (family GH31 glycosyl hydrolase)/AraC-like DNA-binding protein [Paenibacillus eucommiae]